MRFYRVRIDGEKYFFVAGDAHDVQRMMFNLKMSVLGFVEPLTNEEKEKILYDMDIQLLPEHKLLVSDARRDNGVIKTAKEWIERFHHNGWIPFLREVETEEVRVPYKESIKKLTPAEIAEARKVLHGTFSVDPGRYISLVSDWLSRALDELGGHDSGHCGHLVEGDEIELNLPVKLVEVDDDYAKNLDGNVFHSHTFTGGKSGKTTTILFGPNKVTIIHQHQEVWSFTWEEFFKKFRDSRDRFELAPPLQESKKD